MPPAALPLVFNPLAGRGRAGKRVARLMPVFERFGIDLRPEASEAAGDVEARVRALCDAGAERVVVAGGDGSVHEAVNGILASDRPAALGLVPLGTGNDFAKANALPLNPRAAVERLCRHIHDSVAVRRIDVGRLNGRYFANGAGIGFDAKVSAIASSMRHPAGRFVYLAAVLRALADGVTTPEMTLEFDGGRIEGRLTLASFGIGPWVGGLFPIAPMAVTDDGWLDLVHADALTRRQVLALLPKLLKGRHVGLPGVYHRRIRHCRVEAREAVPAHLDGENQPPRRDFEIDILPAALAIL